MIEVKIEAENLQNPDRLHFTDNVDLLRIC
jgi:hypothetical protein